MSIRERLLGNSKKKYSEIRDTLNQVADAHLSPSSVSGNDPHRKFKAELEQFLSERGDLETFLQIMVEADHRVSSPEEAVELYVSFLKKEEFEKLDTINREISNADRGIAQLLENGLKEIEIAAEKRENS